MNNQELDVNLIIQSFQEKLTQMTTELVIKDATIKQLTLQLQQIQQDTFQVPETTKKDK
jgi:hypothetical protein